MPFIRWFIKTTALILIVGILGFVAWTYGSLKYVYSTGERAGYLQKFSKKGWVFKTWEGELSMVNLPGSAPEKFYFTVRDQSVSDQINKALGQRIVLKYNEHKGIPMKIFGDTPYFVTEVHSISDDFLADPQNSAK
ncbi:MAG: hypothetical protein ACKVQC_01980 [Elusimicrobiota bacterium]